MIRRKINSSALARASSEQKTAAPILKTSVKQSADKTRPPIILARQQYNVTQGDPETALNADKIIEMSKLKQPADEKDELITKLQAMRKATTLRAAAQS